MASFCSCSSNVTNQWGYRSTSDGDFCLFCDLKKKANRFDEDVLQGSINQSSIEDNSKVDAPKSWKVLSNRKIVFLVVSVIFGFFIVQQSTVGNPGDEYFKIEQKISAVVSDWNIAAKPLSDAIQSISSGQMQGVEAMQVVSEGSRKFAEINNRLYEECSKIPNYDVNAAGVQGAIGKSYDALKVTCDNLPQEGTEVLLLIREQISPSGTQAQIEYHSNQIAQILEKRKNALIISANALMEYANEGQKANLQRMLDAISSN